jgi:outer membrane receptor protein involved in Fe transport
MTIVLLLMANLVLAQGTIKGTIIDSKSKEPVAFANVVAKQDGKQIRATTTDMDGSFTIKLNYVGKYDIEVSCVSYHKYVREALDVKANAFTVCNVDLVPSSVMLDEVEIHVDKNPVIEIGDASTTQRITGDDIARMPSTSIDGIVAAVGGVGFSDGGTSTARGEDNMVTMQGGVRKRTGVNVPKEAIAEIQVILGGTPASIGEAIGGTQIITLKPPESTFKGIVKYETYLDYRLANNLMMYLTGPVFKQALKDENGGKTGDRTLVGFRLTAQGGYRNNSLYRPKGYRYLVVNDALVREYEMAPISYDPITRSTDYSAERGLYRDAFVELTRPTKDDFGGDASRVPNMRNWSINAEAAFDIRFSDYATLTVTGEYDYSHGANTSLMPLNMSRSANSVSTTTNAVITVDFTQRFPDEEASANNTEGESKSGKAIQNVMYNITGMFNRYKSNTYNETFGGSLDDVFKYGYIGHFEVEKIPTHQLVSNYDYYGISRAAYVQNNWVDQINWDAFVPYEGNQVLANYTLQVLGIDDIAPYLTNFDNLGYYKGLYNGQTPGNIFGLLNNVGVQSTSFSQLQYDYIYLQAKAQADILKHQIEIGFQYDRVDQSYYGLGAYSLWTIMRQNANRHISQMDMTNPHYRWEGSDLYVDYDRLYNQAQQSYFDKAMRDYLGWSGNYEGERTWMDIDRYSPEDYVKAGGLEMFSSDELFNGGGNNSLVAYYGYDHTGKKYNNSNWSLEDFYSPSDAKYRYLPSFSPTYMAGYIQDQFYFQDLIFNVGVRVDYFDGNQFVLKDPYLLYESYTVGDLKKGSIAYAGDIYSGAGDDWVVYVDAADAETPTIYGYRNGSIWYDANGVELASPKSIVGKSSKPTPYRTPAGQRAFANNTVGTDAFEDYTPQVVVMPRIAFSFPVGDNSQFKASYDIIARRPSSGWQADYLDYLYMTQITSTNNPNLKPERITNYELGFQQALNDKSAVSISAYYKETRDLIQLVQYAGADPNQNYYSYDNLDFKTIKGLTLGYDLRQTGHVRISANYTLQYAEGTGLSSTTMQELIKEGYTTLKMLNPISDDRRHEFKANVDFRYFGGKKYDGPKIPIRVKDSTGEDRQKTINILENFGINFMAVAQSGRPYTKAFSNTQSTIVGSYRGARLPWGFYFNVIADKAFPIKVGRRQTMLTVALTVNNLFNIRNITSVYSVTGNPEDNGYLTDPETQTVINSYLDPDSFRDLYAINLRNGSWNYSSPRTFKVTLSYQF